MSKQLNFCLLDEDGRPFKGSVIRVKFRTPIGPGVFDISIDESKTMLYEAFDAALNEVFDLAGFEDLTYDDCELLEIHTI